MKHFRQHAPEDARRPEACAEHTRVCFSGHLIVPDRETIAPRLLRTQRGDCITIAPHREAGIPIAPRAAWRVMPRWSPRSPISFVIRSERTQ